MDRDQAKEAEHEGTITIWRGQQTCPSCGDDAWPLDVIRQFLLPKNHGDDIKSGP
jgi:hypothetical protein